MITIEEYNARIEECTKYINENSTARIKLIAERDRLYTPEWMRDALDDKNVTIKKIVEEYDGLYQLNCSVTYGTLGVFIKQTALCRTVNDYNHFIRMIKEVNHALRA